MALIDQSQYALIVVFPGLRSPFGLPVKLVDHLRLDDELLA